MAERLYPSEKLNFSAPISLRRSYTDSAFQLKYFLSLQNPKPRQIEQYKMDCEPRQPTKPSKFTPIADAVVALVEEWQQDIEFPPTNSEGAQLIELLSQKAA